MGVVGGPLVFNPEPALTAFPFSLFARAPFSVDILNREMLANSVELYLQGRPMDVICNPVLADLAGMPPALVLAGEIELFIDDIRGV